jgi:hypothetical protein
MKQYVIDELRPADYRKIKSYLDEKFGSSALDGIYWVPLDAGYHSRLQAAHTTCQPFYFAIDLEADMMACELLIRTKARVRCDCISYATERQRNWLIGFVDRVFKKLDIKT